MDKIFLRGMTFAARHGVLPHEHETYQRFVVDADLMLDLHAAGKHDDLADTVKSMKLCAGRLRARRRT